MPFLRQTLTHILQYIARLLRIQRCHRRVIVDLDAAPLLLLAVVERQLPPAFLLGRAQPQPHQVAPRRRRRIVLVRRAGVQDVVVGQELDVANVKDHVQREALARLFQDRSGVLLGVRERRDEACVGEARQRADVVGVPSARVSLEHLPACVKGWTYLEYTLGLSPFSR